MPVRGVSSTKTCSTSIATFARRMSDVSGRGGNGSKWVPLWSAPASVPFFLPPPPPPQPAPLSFTPPTLSLAQHLSIHFTAILRARLRALIDLGLWVEMRSDWNL